MNAEPSCKRHAIFPIWYIARLAEEPLWIADQCERWGSIHISSLQEDTKGDPQLPTHDQTPSDGSRRVLGSKHWNR